MEKEKLIIVGTGQLSNDVRFFVERYQLFDIVGYTINEEYIKDDTYKGLPVYPMERLEEYVDKDDVKFYISISWFHYLNRARESAFLFLKEKGFKAANLISPHATVLTDDIGEGNWICDFAYLDFSTTVGCNNVFRNYAYLGHYARVGDHSFLGAKSLIGGNSKIGNRCFIGIAATVFNDVKIGNKCIVGGAAVAKYHLPDFSICKIANDSIFIKQYNEETIDNKLMPVSEYRAKNNK